MKLASTGRQKRQQLENPALPALLLHMSYGLPVADPCQTTKCCAGVDWRQKLENQRGAVLATELKNNANKIAKWTAAALVRSVGVPSCTTGPSAGGGPEGLQPCSHGIPG